MLISTDEPTSASLLSVPWFDHPWIARRIDGPPFHVGWAVFPCRLTPDLRWAALSVSRAP